LRNDFRAPKTIEHLFPRRLNRWQEKLIKEPGRGDETCNIPAVSCGHFWFKRFDELNVSGFLDTVLIQTGFLALA
jgi:hypothetical protein